MHKIDCNIKVIVIGDAGVGKTSIVRRYIDGEFFPGDEITIGVDYSVKYLTVDGMRVRLGIYDTSGHKRFDLMVETFRAKSDCVVYVFDLSNPKTFNSHGWGTRGFSGQSITVVGNKSDKPPARKWESHIKSRAQFQKHSDRTKDLFGDTAEYIESSAKSDYNISELFEEVVRRVIRSKSLQETVDLTKRSSRVCGGCE